MTDTDAYEEESNMSQSSVSESEGERVDYSESDDESEAKFTSEDEERSASKAGSKRSKSGRDRKRKRPRFVEMEAEVGDEDEDEEDEEDDLTRQFIADDDELEAEASHESETGESNMERYRELARRQDAEDIDAEAEEQRLKKLYGRAHRLPKLDSKTQVPKQFLLPTVTDPKLWLVRCKIGKERAAVHQLLKAVLESQSTEAALQVFSATALDNLKGYVYIEAFKPSQIAEAIDRAHITHLLFAGGATGSKVVLVPLNEMTDVLKFAPTTKVSVGEITMPELGDFVRIKRGKYAQDLAQVVEVPEEFETDNLGSVQVRLKILPRINYQTEGVSIGRKASSDRPIARLFDQHEAAKFGSVTKSRGYWIFAGEMYKDGFLFKDARLSSLITDNVKPKKFEKERLGVLADDEEKEEDSGQKATVQSAKLQPGERVLIKSGDFKNMIGVIDGITEVEANSDAEPMARITLESASISSPVNVRIQALDRLFRLGDNVRVIFGEQSGIKGMVVDIEKKNVTIYSDSGAQLVTSKNSIQLAHIGAKERPDSESALGASFKASAKFTVFDLVQTGSGPVDFGLVMEVNDADETVSFMDSNGDIKKEKIEGVSRVMVPRKFDDEFKEGDRVFDPKGEQKVLLAHYRGFAFLRKLEGGSEVNVYPITQVSKVQSTAATYKPVAPRYASGGSALIGKSVTISGGPYKGYIGIVKELIDTMARVELHTNSKLVSVDRERLSVVGAGGDAHRQGMTPGVAVGKTPAWGTSSTGKTPAWGPATGKTPAWSTGTGKTPAWSSTTPAWNAKSATGKTPSWAPSKTPSWQQPQQYQQEAQSRPAPAAAVNATWAIPNAELLVSGERLKLVTVDGGMLTLSGPSGQKTCRVGEASPVLPAKKDRVAIHNLTPILYGVVIGLDGPDAVVKIDGTGEFKIVNINSLVKLL